MTREEVLKIPRKAAVDLLASIPESPEKHLATLAIEVALNVEWWRGFHAFSDERTTPTK